LFFETLLTIIYCSVDRRVTKNSSFFSEVEQAFLSLSGVRKAVGGNAPVMAKRFVEEGVEVVLGAQMSSVLREQLHPKIKGSLASHLPMS
jgi:hypothetical protein